MHHWASFLPALSSRTNRPLPFLFLHPPCFSYIGDCEISVELQKIRAGVNGIQVSEDAMTATPVPAVGSGKWNQLTPEPAVKDTMVPDMGW